MVIVNQCQAQNEHFCGEVEVYFELRTHDRLSIRVL